VFELPTESDPVKVIENDCRTVLGVLPTGAISSIITDPPFGISLSQHEPGACWDGTRRKRERSWAIESDDSLEVAERVIEWADEQRLPLVMFASPYRPLPGKWRNVLVWDKGPAVGGGGDPSTCWKRTFEMIYTRRTPMEGGRDEAVLRVPVNTGSDFEFHPCQKPIPLLRYLIRKVTRPGDLILDPFAGSGATGIAAAKEGRRCLLIESDPAYAQICRERVAKALDAGLFADVA
jgi:hypothetical protein